MEKKKRAEILGCDVDQVTLAEAVGTIGDLIDAGKPAQVVTLNVEMVHQAQSNMGLRDIINQAALITPDGIGIIWAGRKLGYNLRERASGIDLLYCLCEKAPTHNWGIYLLGSSPEVAAAAANKLKETNPGLKICGTHDGYFQEKDLREIVGAIKESRPQILFVGLGSPKQEMWIKDHYLELGVPVCIGVGGSFDVIAGIKNRAPSWVIKLNLEWLYRLMAEPTRIKRQSAIPKFILQVLKNSPGRESEK